ncbi:MAG: hypothetical protein RM368_35205 [Nostoc sp. DedSLP03]|uniref:hypothetical protein n=1 Tax=Nostoc sp. DedSLP03 TaxID=3075400 RepID=UPI002AD3BC44|nr:hypothetical protein [Nostoc sp. DedSLP03]MDZ7970128.1 hypothetical protein [Nostoc sp. DedSLP03]
MGDSWLYAVRRCSNIEVKYTDCDRRSNSWLDKVGLLHLIWDLGEQDWKQIDARINIDDLLRQAGWNPADKSQVMTEVSAH